MKRKFIEGFSCLGCTLGFLIINAILHLTYRRHNAKMEQQAVQQKIVYETQRIKEQNAYNERKRQRQDKRNNLIDQWTKHMGKLVNGKYITVSLEDYKKMSEKERKKWNGE